jgi:hypothetical protein
MKLLASAATGMEVWMAGKARKSKSQATPPRSSADGDDTVITALDLAPAELTPAMRAYFDKCMEKLGFVPNVLKAYAFDMAKLEAFIAMYNDLMLAPSGLSKLERENRGRGVLGEPLLLLLYRPWCRRARAVGRSRARRVDGDELPRRPARPAPAGNA